MKLRIDGPCVHPPQPDRSGGDGVARARSFRMRCPRASVGERRGRIAPDSAWTLLRRSGAGNSIPGSLSASGTVHVPVFAPDSRSVELTLTDILGRVVISRQRYDIKEGDRTIVLDVSGGTVTAGVYILTLTSNGARAERTFVLVK